MRICRAGGAWSAENGGVLSVRVEIRLGSVAMSEPQHVAAALSRVASRIERGELVAGSFVVLDGNDELVGRVVIGE